MPERADYYDHDGRHEQGCVLRDDHHQEPCVTALPVWWEADCKACTDVYGDPRTALSGSSGNSDDSGPEDVTLGPE